VPQGVSADLIASLEGFTRQDVDAFALRSQQRAAAAQQNGYFKSIVPVRAADGRVLLDCDEHARPDATLEGLGALKPAFVNLGAMGFDAVALRKYPQLTEINHVHTAGNSSRHRRWRGAGVVGGRRKARHGAAAAGAQVSRPRCWATSRRSC
jgi:acetyl-CoA C-acetyltransferase